MQVVPQEHNRAAIESLQAELLARPCLHADLAVDAPLVHHFAPGVYGREITIPAGLLIIGKLHRHAHLNIISAGRILVFTEFDGVQELCAPCSFISQPGTKRVVYALETTVWTTIHPTDSRDLEEIEREVIAPDYATLEQEQALCLGVSWEQQQLPL